MSLKYDIGRHGVPMCEYLAGATLVHHADPSGVSQLHRGGMMLEYSTGDQGGDALRHHAVLNVLKV